MYDPTNWYWNVANSATANATVVYANAIDQYGNTVTTVGTVYSGTVYSSAFVSYVPTDNAAYVAWSNVATNHLTNIGSEAELADMFATSYPAGWAKPVIISSYDFFGRFTAEEQANIANAAIGNPTSGLYMNNLTSAAAGTINLANAIVIAGVEGLEQAGLIASGRASVILTP